MKKNIAIVALSVLFILAGITTFSLLRDNRQKDDQISELRNEMQEQEDYLHAQEGVNHSTTEVGEKTMFVNEAFNGYLNYTSETYQSRFNDMQEHFSSETIQKLQGAGTGSTPEVSIQSSTSDYRTYVNPTEENSFVFVTDLEYIVDDNAPSTFTNLYLVELSEEEGDYIISNVDVFSGSPTNQ